MRIIIILIFLNCIISFSNAQKRDAVWCFGDSAMINFSDTSNIITNTSIVKSRGSSASICDSTGSLLFYTGYDNDVYSIGGPPFKNGEIIDKLHNLMQNGDSIVMQLWYHEAVIVDDPSTLNQYYVFSIGVTFSGQQGLFYSIVNMNANGGLGAVTQKNIQLQNFEMVDCLTAIKHGNGRDWWVIFRRWNDSPPAPNNEFYSYLISPIGISNYSVQNVGAIQSTGFGNISFNVSGNKMVFVNYKGLLELYDFDRCSGVISNPETIYSENTQPPWPQRWSAESSPSGNLLYVTHVAAFSPDSCYLVQYNLTASNIAASADTIWRTPFMLNMGQLKLAPDGKIYLSNNYYGGYPYNDTTYNMYNMNLSVINLPDSLGMACSLQPYSFYLGGKRTYFGLPNNPDYDLSALAGSPCDSLTAMEEISGIQNPNLFVYYNHGWQTAFINAEKLKGKQYSLQVYDLMGKEVFRESGHLGPPYFTKNLNCQSFANGMYIVSFKTEYEQLTRRFVVD